VKLTTLLSLIVLGVVALVAFDRYTTYTAERAEVVAAEAKARAKPRAPAGEPAWGSGTRADSAVSEGDPDWESVPTVVAPPAAAASSFRCDGRTHCSQMTSCAEAEFFLHNCPNTKMDGNNDGEPCERQWCG